MMSKLFFIEINFLIVYKTNHYIWFFVIKNIDSRISWIPGLTQHLPGSWLSRNRKKMVRNKKLQGTLIILVSKKGSSFWKNKRTSNLFEVMGIYPSPFLIGILNLYLLFFDLILVKGLYKNSYFNQSQL